jgi:hypothetical protein
LRVGHIAISSIPKFSLSSFLHANVVSFIERVRVKLAACLLAASVTLAQYVTGCGIVKNSFTFVHGRLAS